MHRNNAIPKAKSLTFESTVIFKNPHAYLQFVCWTASQPAVSPDSARYSASKVTLKQ